MPDPVLAISAVVFFTAAGVTFQCAEPRCGIRFHHTEAERACADWWKHMQREHPDAVAA